MDFHLFIANDPETARRQQLNLFENCSLVKNRMVIMDVADRVKIEFQLRSGQVGDGFDTRAEQELFIIDVVIDILEPAAIGAYNEPLLFYICKYKRKDAAKAIQAIRPVLFEKSGKDVALIAAFIFQVGPAGQLGSIV